MNTNNFIQRDGKTVIPVPAGIRYMSEWTDFDLNFFNGPYIVDKQIPGCGFTEYCLTNNDNIILCSPRKILLSNKELQHLGEIHYAKNEFDQDLAVDKDISKPNRQKTDIEIHEELSAIELMRSKLLHYCFDRASQRKPIKVIVTYDSFFYVKNALEAAGILSSFQIVVDEFQSIFVDSRFKASTEFDFLEHLKQVNNSICFVSATPMLDKYLAQLDEFKSLPFYELDWGMLDPGRVMRPELKVRKIKSVSSEVKRIIREYKNGEFAILANPLTGQLVKSTEAVFYLNSVNDILKIIKAEGLTPDEVNILCSDTPQNRLRLKKRLGKSFSIGTVPLRNHPHKMFTFCTRTVYLGADFYSNNARTFVLSDANIDSLAVDISLDLPQILGRQRLIENPWKNHAEFYFKNLGGSNELSKADFDKRVQEKLEFTSQRLSIFNKGTDKEQRALIENYRDCITLNNYSKDYVSVNNQDGINVPVLNRLVLIAEQRAFDIQQIDYKDRFTVFNALRNESGFRMDEMCSFIETLRDTKVSIPVRLKSLCETEDFTEEEKKIIAQQASELFDKYYNLIGPKRCKALGYDSYLLRRELSNLLVDQDSIRSEMHLNFIVGNKYQVSEIKEKLSAIYNKLHLNKNPKATDLEDYFLLKRTKTLDSSGNRVSCLEILGIK